MSLQTENHFSVEAKPQLIAGQPPDYSQVEWQEPPAMSLDERGMIKDCSKSLEMLLGFRRSELVWHHVSMVFPQFEGIEIFQDGQVNPKLNYFCRCGQSYQAQKRQGDAVPSKLNFVCLENQGKRTLRLFVRP
jgi:hypothetical protein